MEELVGTGNNHRKEYRILWTERFFYIAMAPPPRIAFSPDAFSFDLQRFEDEPNSEGGEGGEGGESGAGEGGETPAGNGLATTPTTTEGDSKSVFSCEIDGKTYYGKADEFTTDKLKGATKITLLDNFETSQGSGKETITNATITLNPALELSQSCTLDLNGKTLTISSAANGIFVKAAGEGSDSNVLTLMDSSTEKTGKINHTAAEGDKMNGAIKLGYGAKKGSSPAVSFEATDNKGGVGLIMLGGTVISTKSSAVAAGNNSTITIQDGCTLESGENEGCGVYFGNNPPSKAGLDSSLTMTGGTITSNSSMPAIQVSGTMTDKINVPFTATIDISGGKVEFTKKDGIYDKNTKQVIGDPMAIYASGNTDLKISGGEIISTGTGVELKSGSVEVTGGTVTSTCQDYNVAKNSGSNGATSFGAAIAISTRDNGSTINVKISGDNTNISGANALAVGNTVNSTSKVTATIDGGNLTSNKTDSKSNRIGNAILADNSNVTITVNDGKLNGNVAVAKIQNTTNNDATIVVNGGTTSGTVKVVSLASAGGTETVIDPDTASDEDKATAKSALKVTGGKITDKSSASKYITPGTTVSDNGTVTEIAGANGWSLQGDGNNEHYAYYIGTGAESIITASISSSTGDAITNNILRYDKTNKLFGIPTVAANTFTWVKEEENKRMYNLAIYHTDGKAVTIRPETSNVKISGTGFIDSTIVTLAVSEASSLGVAVDATDNNLAHIIGAKGNDKFIAGDRNTTLDGGEGNDVLEGNSGNDLFLYSAGKDQINNYTYDSDVVSLNGDNLTPPIDFSKATYDGKKIIINFDDVNKLTLDGAAKVALLKTANNVTDTYTYDARSAGVWNYIAHEGHGISLGTGYTGTQYPGQNEEYKTIDASNVTRAIRIRGNDDGNYIVGSKLGGVLEGNDGNDSLYGTGVLDSLTLNGGAGNDLMFGGSGYNNFVYSEGKDTISGYHDKDLINVTGRAVSFADVAVSVVGADESNKTDLLISFDSDNQLSIAGGATLGSPISIKSGRNNYAFTKDYFALNGKSITLTSSYDDGKNQNYKTYDGADESYETINAGLVEGAISIVGNANNNYIVGGLGMNSLDGGASDDTLVGGTTADKTNLFYYTAGKDVIENFRTGDKLAIDADLVGDIKSGKLTNSKLTFTINKKSDDLTFKFGDNDPFGKVSLNSGNAYLTKDGVASIKSGTDYSLDLFASAKGRIDLTDTLYSGASIKSVNAESAKNQTVTLVGGKQGGTFAYATNKKRDGFEYGGGYVSISGYEGGRDRIDLNGASLTSFAVSSDDVVLNIGNGTGSISITSAAGEEVLLRDAGSRGYKKMVFAAPGIVQNKKSNPTTATVSSGEETKTYSFADRQTVKKIFVTDVAAGTSIQAGNRNNTIIDASNAGAEVSLSGGAKNDKLIGSSYGDLFIYGAGKDVVQGFGTGDSISLSGDQSAKLESAKITASKKVIKFKFSNKDVLTVKSDDTMTGALNIDGTEKIYFKNAIGSGVRTSLTSEFSGTFRTQDSKRTLSEVTYVNGSKVKKNLTFSGSSESETLIGGGKKTMFKGGGGADSLVAGDSKDTFFYAKGDEGNATISNFDFGTDKLKVSGGIIGNIEQSGNTITFGMTKGKSTDAVVGSFNITSDKDGNDITPSKVAIKANNTLYWFASDDDTSKYVSVDDGSAITAGTLITTENRISNVSAIPIEDEVSVIDLNYSTNLAKSGVAIKVKSKTTT